MSNNKSSNGTSRQLTLTQMNQTLTNKSIQSTNNGSNNKSKPVSSNRKPNPTNNSNKKPQIHQIINLEKQQFTLNNSSANVLQGKNEQLFVGELAKKCGAFFNWINQVDHNILAEQLWKNKMMVLVGQRFPELNTEEQQKIIERDWKIMAPQRREAIIRQMLHEVPYEAMDRQVNERFDLQRNQIYMQFAPKENVMMTE